MMPSAIRKLFFSTPMSLFIPSSFFVAFVLFSLSAFSPTAFAECTGPSEFDSSMCSTSATLGCYCNDSDKSYCVDRTWIANCTDEFDRSGYYYHQKSWVCDIGDHSPCDGVVPECFLAGTKIDTPDGQRNIEDLKAGDKVLSFDKTTGKTVENTVLTPIVTIKNAYYTLKSILGKEVKVTAEHPFYTGATAPNSPDVEAGFEKVKDLKTGDTLYIRDGDTIVSDAVASMEYIQDKQKVYNLRVKNPPFTFFANGLAVHNKGEVPASIVINPDNVSDRADPDRYDVYFSGIPLTKDYGSPPHDCGTVGIGDTNNIKGQAVGCGEWETGSGTCRSMDSDNDIGANASGWFYNYNYASQNNGYLMYKAKSCGSGDDGTRDHWDCGTMSPGAVVSTTGGQITPGSRITLTFTSSNAYEYVRLHHTTGEVVPGDGHDRLPSADPAYLNNCTYSGSGSGPFTYSWTCTAPNTGGVHEVTFSNRQNCEKKVAYMVEVPTAIAGKVVDAVTKAGMSGVTIQVYNGDTLRETTTTGNGTYSNGTYSVDTTNFVNPGTYYDVRVKGNMEGTAPIGYIFPAKPTTTSYSWSYTDNRDTQTSDLYYKTQQYGPTGYNDCAGPAGAGGATGRCNFEYSPIVAEGPICTDPMPSCPVGSQILANPTFDGGSSSWGFYSAPAPNNAAGLWERGALKMTSFGAARSGWSQTINVADGYLWGKKLRVAANIYRSANQGSSPYIGLNIKRIGSPSWEYNFGGTTAVSTVNTCSQIAREITVPTDLEQIQAFVYNWDASAGFSYTDWLSLCQVAAPPPIIYTCIGTLPASATLCTGDDQGLTVETPYAEVPACTIGRKCEYTTSIVLPCAASGTCVCTGTPPPASATLCTGDDQNLGANTPYTEVTACTAGTKCEYTIPIVSTCADTRSCVCTGSLPSNTALCVGDDQGLLVNAPLTHVSTCTDATKCEYTATCNYSVCTVDTECGAPDTCYGGFCRNSACPSSTTPAADGNCACPAVCTGTLPATGQVCLNDDQGLSVDTPYSQVPACTDGAKCEYTLPPANATYVLGRIWQDKDHDFRRLDLTEPLLTSSGVNHFADVSVDVSCGSWNGEAYYDAVNDCDSEGRGPYETGWIGKDSVNGPCTITATVTTPGWYFTSSDSRRNWGDTMLPESCVGYFGDVYTGTCLQGSVSDNTCTKVRVVLSDWFDNIKNYIGFVNMWFAIDGVTPTPTPAPTYTCTGILPPGANFCDGDDQGLASNTPLTPVATCTDGAKCEYIPAASVGASACEVIIGGLEQTGAGCRSIRANSEGLIFDGGKVTCPD